MQGRQAEGRHSNPGHPAGGGLDSEGLSGLNRVSQLSRPLELNLKVEKSQDGDGMRWVTEGLPGQ